MIEETFSHHKALEDLARRQRFEQRFAPARLALMLDMQRFIAHKPTRPTSQDELGSSDRPTAASAGYHTRKLFPVARIDTGQEDQ